MSRKKEDREDLLTEDKRQGSLKGLFWAGWRTSVEIEVPSSSETVGTHSNYSHVTQTSQSTMKSHGKPAYNGAEAWWSAGDFMHPDVTSNNQSAFSKTNDDDTWDLSDSIVDLYKEVNKYDSVQASNQSPTPRKAKVDVQEWIQEDTSNGFVHVFKSDTDTHPKMFPCTLTTTAQKLCIQCGMPPNSLHVQLNGDIIRRLEPFDSPLAIQNEYLQNIGYSDQRKIQEIGSMEDLTYLVKFYAGKPVSDSTYSRNQLSVFAYVRKGKLLHQWVRRLCVITGTRLLIYRDKTKTGNPTIVQLAKGAVEEVKNIKGHDHVLKLTSTLQGERSVYLSFTEEKDYNKWIRKTKKATAKLPTKADLSNCHLEFLPETVFINDGLEILNLRHNVLKERPIEEDIYTIGWLDDLPRFTNLRSLNLADNNLRCFPVAVCQMKTLTELNLASNKIEDIPPTIKDLENLQILHLHNNLLTYLPDEMCRMSQLLVLVLAFNRFTTVPHMLLHPDGSSLRIDSLIMAGNQIEKLSHEVLNKIKHIKKIDFRMNKLTFSPNEMAKFHLLELVTHLDVRDNIITDLDVRPLRNLEYLNCERNKVHSLQVSGGAIKTLLAMNNEISSFMINPKPEWLATLDISHNKLEALPSWISDCFFLVQLNASHNNISQLPDRLLLETQKLRVLQMSHNKLSELPSDVGATLLEELSLEHNQLMQLPDDIFVKLPKLRYICLTNNKLETIPAPNQNLYQNKLQELYLSANLLDDDVIPKIIMFQKLRVLHLAYNRITEVHDRDLKTLENLQELNISGNYLRHLPKCVGRHPKLQALRSNANLLKELPDFRCSPNLKVLEVGSNRLMDISVTSLMASNVNLLDISGNPEMQVSSMELRGIKTKKKVCMVDIKGQNRSLLDLRTAGFEDLDIPWQSGLSQTSGMRNKLSVSIVNRPKFNEGKEGLFALFDGGRNDEVTRILSNRITALLEEESQHPITSQEYLKYTLLSAHRKLKSTGQKIGATGAICHIHRPTETNANYTLNIANVGDTEIVLCRRGEAVVLSKLFTIDRNKEEMERICKAGGIVTEDNKINGVTHNTRLLGSSYLFPYVVPDPHVQKVTLQPDDQLIIIANQGLWRCMSYQETVNEIIKIPDPVLAAKKLQDLAQGYRSQENIGVLVVRLMLSNSEKNHMRDMLKYQFEKEQKLLAELKIRDIEREEMKKRMELEEQNENVSRDVVKMKDKKKRKQVGQVFNGSKKSITDDKDVNGLSIKPLPHGQTDDPTADWEIMLQKRLAEEVKDKELIHAMRSQTDYDPYFPVMEADENWSTTTKLKGQMKERVVTLPPQDNFDRIRTGPAPPIKHMIPEADQLSTGSVEFRRELKHPLDVDRDAVLFHNMQLQRHKNHNMSSRSIDSIQSDPAFASTKDVPLKQKKTSSHSIEVLLHGPPPQHKRQISFGGSQSLVNDEATTAPAVDQNKKTDSCPIDMTDRLKMLEQKGFLPKENEQKTTRSPKTDRKIQLEEIEHMEEHNEIAELDSGADMNGVESDDSDDDADDDFEFFPDYETVESVQRYRENMKDKLEKENTSPKFEPKIYDEINVNDDSEHDEDQDEWKGRYVDAETDSSSEDINALYATVTKVKTNAHLTLDDNSDGEADKKDKVAGERLSPVLIEDKHEDENKATKVVHGFKTTVSTEHRPESTKTRRPPPPPKTDLSMIYDTPTNDQNGDIEGVMSFKDSTCGESAVSDTNPKTGDDHTIETKVNIDGIGKDGKGVMDNDNGNEAKDMKEEQKDPSKQAPPIPPRMPIKAPLASKPDINSNSIRSLEDLIAYNRQQQQKLSYKINPKAAPSPPPKVPETTMVTKTASQRSIVITYL